MSKINLDLLKSAHAFFKFIYDSRILLCKDDKCTINLVLLVYNRILRLLEFNDDEDDRLKELKTLYRISFISKFKILDIHKHATFLTPNFKELNNLVNDEERRNIFLQKENCIKVARCDISQSSSDNSLQSYPFNEFKNINKNKRQKTAKLNYI